MYRIGYIDDQATQFRIYKKKIDRRFPDVELIFLENCTTKEQFLDKIYEERIEVLLVDYKMAATFGFNGSTLINYINDQMRDLECFIMTAVDQDSISDGLIATRNIKSKTIFDTEADDEQRVKELNEFIDVLRESARVFKTRSEQKKKEYIKLFEKRQKGQLTMNEEEEYRRLYKVLSSYGLIEKLPDEVLTYKFEQDLNELIKCGERILEEHKK